MCLEKPRHIAFVQCVGNKADLKDRRRVPAQAAHMLADWWQIPYVEPSGTTADGVREAFYIIAETAVKRIIAQEAADAAAEKQRTQAREDYARCSHEDRKRAKTAQGAAHHNRTPRSSDG